AGGPPRVASPPPDPPLREPPAAPSASTEGDGAPAGDALVLFSYPLLVDEGTLSVEAGELKDALEETPFVEVHTADAERLGLADGEMVVISTGAGSARLTVRVTDGIQVGTVFVPWNQPGFAANTLLSGSSITTSALQAANEPAEATAR